MAQGRYRMIRQTRDTHRWLARNPRVKICAVIGANEAQTMKRAEQLFDLPPRPWGGPTPPRAA